MSLPTRDSLFERSDGKCERCGVAITADTFHIAAQGPTDRRSNSPATLAAWCAKCQLMHGHCDGGGSRVGPRDWQEYALPVVTERIQHSKVATIAAAPGAGKTVFASLVFESLRARGLIDRMVVLVPRRTLLKQWHDSLYNMRRIQLRPDGEVERLGQDGVIVTYQSLNESTVGVHAKQARMSRTLFVLDEVHHVGEPVINGGRPAWARFVTELVGDVSDEIHVAGVLNLSGTLWRSKKSERISTVRYVTENDGRLKSDVDYEINASELIANGHLRPVDLFRRGATVELVNVPDAQRIISPIEDLDQGPVGRAAIRELPSDASWRTKFVEAILERLELRHRDMGNGPAKALIVARSQTDARAFQETANQLMVARGLAPFAELAVSDEPDASKTLENFRRADKPGVLCTVDMAGEGYDCPEITVIGYATNKLTPLYIRQVVARAQRVTDYERETLKRPIAAAVIIPDVPQLVESMSNILEPIRHTIRDPIEDVLDEQSDADGQQTLAGLSTLQSPNFQLDQVNGLVEGDARVTGDLGGDVGMDLVRIVEPEARRVGLPESDAPRMILAVREAINNQREKHPFDTISLEQQDLASTLSSSPTKSGGQRTEALSIEELASALQGELKYLAGWWHHNGDSDIVIFNAEVNRSAGIKRGGRPTASVEKLQAAVEFARREVARRCAASGASRPRPFTATNSRT